MTDDLTARLTGALDALEDRERDTRLDVAELAAIHRDVRRRRTTRTVQHASVAAVAVVAVATAGWFGLHRPPVEPVETPTPSPTSTATRTPTPTPTPTSAGPVHEDTAGLDVVERPGAARLYAMPPGLLDRTGPGWTLVRGYGYLRDDEQVSEGVISLVAPDGTSYLVADVVGSVTLAAWDGGPTAVVVTQTDEGELGVRGTLDLRSGAVTPDVPTVSRLSQLVGRTADGAEVWEGYGQGGTTTEVRVVDDGTDRTVLSDLRSGSTVAVSPDGRRVVVDEHEEGRDVLVADLTTGTTTSRPAGPAGHLCWNVGW